RPHDQPDGLAQDAHDCRRDRDRPHPHPPRAGPGPREAGLGSGQRAGRRLCRRAEARRGRAREDAGASLRGPGPPHRPPGHRHERLGVLRRVRPAHQAGLAPSLHVVRRARQRVHRLRPHRPGLRRRRLRAPHGPVEQAGARRRPEARRRRPEGAPEGGPEMRRLLCALLLAAGCATPGAATDPALRIGTAEVDITPPLGYRMAGYFYERLNTGTKDPLKAKAIVFEQGSQRAALVFCDLIGVPSNLTSKARQDAERATGIPAANISIAATHSHTGPLFYGGMARILHERAEAAKGKDPQDFDFSVLLADRLVMAIQHAASRTQPASLWGGRAEETEFSFSRRF